jgi:hypothetical protein
MGFFDYLLPGLAAGAGALINKSGKSTQTTTTPAATYDPATTALRGNIISGTNDTLTQDPNLEGYKANQISSLNHNSDIQKQKILENAALHGVSGPALGASLDNADSQRFAGITNLNQTVPLQALQMRQQVLANANNIFSASPKSVTTSSVGTSPSNKAGGAFSGLAESLAYLYGKGAFGKKPGATKPGVGSGDLPAGSFGLPGGATGMYS